MRPVVAFPRDLLDFVPHTTFDAESLTRDNFFYVRVFVAVATARTGAHEEGTLGGMGVPVKFDADLAVQQIRTVAGAGIARTTRVSAMPGAEPAVLIQPQFIDERAAELSAPAPVPELLSLYGFSFGGKIASHISPIPITKLAAVTKTNPITITSSKPS